MFGTVRKILQDLNRRRRAATTPAAVVGLIISVAFIAASLPTLVELIQNVSTAGWTFTGHVGAAAIWGLAAFAIVGGLVIMIVKSILD
jgi:ABC-type long-subunit fatty acid transport system fused permease/ATPase subunit